jgi:hypothetical protein
VNWLTSSAAWNYLEPSGLDGRTSKAVFTLWHTLLQSLLLQNETDRYAYHIRPHFPLKQNNAVIQPEILRLGKKAAREY